MRRHAVMGSAILALGVLAGSGAAQAESGYLPFYGYSDYFGGPAVYYTQDTDVQQTTRPDGGALNMGVRTYSAGGPFWYYKPAQPASYRPARRRHKAIVRAKG